jgi:hypothetical protein
MRHCKLLIGTTALALLTNVSMAFPQGTGSREHGGPAMNQNDRGPGGNGQSTQPGRSQSQPGTRNSDQTTGQSPNNQGQPQRGMKGRDESTGQGSRQGTGRAGQRERDETTGQQPRQQDQAPAARQGEQHPQAQPRQGETHQQQSAPETQGQAGGRMTLSAEQRTQFRELIFSSGNVPRATNVNFTISVGTVIPRRVRLEPLPTVVVDEQPAWRGFMYFVVGEEIIVVEPNSLKIVAVIAV